jgi:hypothetical protein
MKILLPSPNIAFLVAVYDDFENENRHFENALKNMLGKYPGKPFRCVS